MIQTKQPIVFGERDEKLGIIKLEARPQQTTKTETKYLILDFSIVDGVQDAYKTKNYEYSNAKKNQVNAYIEANYNLSSLTYSEKEWCKVCIGLMLDTTTNLLPSGKTVYRCMPIDWEYSPEVIEMFPFLAQ